MEFKSRFAEARHAAGLTMRDVADELGLTFQSVQKWEKGINQPRGKRLNKIAVLLGVTVGWLMSGEFTEGNRDIGHRIKQRRIELSRKDSLDNEEVYDLQSAAKACGIPLLRYCMIEEGKRLIFHDELKQIADAFRIDLDDLMNLSPTAKPLDLVALDHFEALEKIAPSKIAIPVYENVEVSAGHGVSNDDETPTDMLWLEKSWLRQIAHITLDEMAVVKVRGDSMEPTLSPGDMILIDRQPIERHQLNDGVYVINRNGTTHVKRLQSTENGIRIISDNRALYDPETVTDGLTICGRVIWAWRGKRF